VRVHDAAFNELCNFTYAFYGLFVSTIPRFSEGTGGSNSFCSLELHDACRVACAGSYNSSGTCVGGEMMAHFLYGKVSSVDYLFKGVSLIPLSLKGMG
jgi:hypothetical protein